MAVLPLAISLAALKPPVACVQGPWDPQDHPPSAWIQRWHLVGQAPGLYACVWDMTAATGLVSSGRSDLCRPVSSLDTRAGAGLASGP